MTRFEKRCSNAVCGRTRIPSIACAFMATLVGILVLSSCGTRRARVHGTMYVPPGLQGNAQWGEVWLVHDSPELEYDLKERERLVTLALLGKDVEFLRRQLPALIQLGVLREKINILNRGQIPTAITLPPRREITALTPFDSIFQGIVVESRPATAPELAAGLDKLKDELRDSVEAIHRRLQTSMDSLRAARAEQKRIMFAGANGSATPKRVMAAPVGLDGRFSFSDVPPGKYRLHAQYRLQQWFVSVPLEVGRSDVQKDIPRLPGVLLDSRAIINTEALCAKILAL